MGSKEFEEVVDNAAQAGDQIDAPRKDGTDFLDIARILRFQKGGQSVSGEAETDAEAIIRVRILRDDRHPMPLKIFGDTTIALRRLPAFER